jgi:hypothetical protein
MKIATYWAVRHVGSKAALARLFDITPQALNRWRGPENDGVWMPEDRADELVKRIPACAQYVGRPPPDDATDEEPEHVELPDAP